MRKYFALALLVLVVGCEPKPTPPPAVIQFPQVHDYSNGVWYFPYAERDFAKALSAFKSQHPNLVVTAMSGDGNGVYGRDIGYFVSTEVRKVN